MTSPPTGQQGLLTPVWADTAVAAATSDAAVVAALLEVESSWAQVLADAGLAPAASAEAIGALCREAEEDPAAVGLDPHSLAGAAVGGGNPVIPLLAEVRRRLQARGASDAALHRGATSQDILDTALVLVLRRSMGQVLEDLLRAGRALSRLAEEHRDTVCAARSLTQHALPTTFGLRAAQWLESLTETADRLRRAADHLPLQWGGAAGTQAALVELAGSTGQDSTDQAEPTDQAEALTTALAARLGLPASSLPWHTRRGVFLEGASAASGVLASLGTLAADVLTLQRPEIGELREPAAPGRGGSSAMPQKQNPVLSILIRSAAMAGPGHLSTLHQAAAAAVDERPDGAWHAEWPALTELLRLTGGAAARAAELCEGLQVVPEAMTRNLELTGAGILGERLLARLSDVHPGGAPALKRLLSSSGTGEVGLAESLRGQIPEELIDDAELARLLDPAEYLGRAGDFVDAARHRFDTWQTTLPGTQKTPAPGPRDERTPTAR